MCRSSRSKIRRALKLLTTDENLLFVQTIWKNLKLYFGSKLDKFKLTLLGKKKTLKCRRSWLKSVELFINSHILSTIRQFRSLSPTSKLNINYLKKIL